jgi:hypothetical protein
VGDGIRIVPDEHETNYVSPVSTRFQPDIQSLASSALLFPTPPWHHLDKFFTNYLSSMKFNIQPGSLTTSYYVVKDLYRPLSNASKFRAPGGWWLLWLTNPNHEIGGFGSRLPWFGSRPGGSWVGLVKCHVQDKYGCKAAEIRLL